MRGTTWTRAPILSDPNQSVTVGGRQYELFYSGAHLDVIAWKGDGAAYWIHNTLTDSIGNRELLAIAEQTELIEQLTKWVLRTALSEVRDLERVWDEDLAVAVNVSARSISRAGFAEDIIETLQALDVPAQRLIIEVTETALMTDPAGAAGILAKLAAAGVNISLDDFGRGQTSLGYLSALPVHELKIDKSFVLGMLQNPAHAAIVRSIIDLGHNLGLRVVGEGVETDDVLTALREAGCDVAQGFLFARPKPAAELRRGLKPEFPAAAPSRPAIPEPRTAAIGV